MKLGNPEKSTQNSPIKLFLYYQLINTHHITSKTLTGIKNALVDDLCRTTQHKSMKKCTICTGVVWLVVPAAIALSIILGANEAICKLTT